MRKFLLNLLFVALTVPWVTQVNAQCDNNAPMCNISIEMFDAFGDGWNGGTLSIYQGTVLRGAVEMDMDMDVQTVSIPVCPDSIRLVWTPGSYDEECSFNIYDAGGTLLLSMAEGSLETASGDLITIYATCPSCLRPASFTTTGNTPTSIDLEWIDSVATTWQMVYGPVGINPDSVLAQIQQGEVLDNLTTNTLTISDLEAGVPMDFYLRADCGAGDYSTWKPLLGIAAGTYNMAATGIDTITTCGMVIYDDGGINGNYAVNANSTLIIYPTDGNVISMYGSINSENNYDYLKIYDGAGTSGPLLGDFAGNVTIDPFISDLGPITLVFTSDGSTQYSGFELFVSCVEAPACARPYSPAIVSLGNSDVTIAWVDSTATYNYEIEYDTVGFEVGNGTILTTTDTVYQLTELLSNTEYEAHIRIICQNGGYSTDRIIRFRTACDPYPTDSLPFIENFDDWTSIDPCWKTKNSSATSTYPSLSSSQSITSNGKSIYMYNSSSGMYNMISLPMFESDVNTLQVSFWLRKPNSSYNHAVQVGVCTNSTDASTFEALATVAPAAVGTWEQFTVYLNNYTGEGKFITFRTPSSITYDQLYLDSVTVSPLPTCTAPENIRVAAVGPFSAMVAWEPNVVGEMSSYTLEISETGMDAWTSYNTTDIYTSISGLTLGTTYDVRVRTDCTDESSVYSDVISFTTLSCTGSGSVNGTVDSVFVGDTASTGTSSYLPTYTFYNYSYTQQIFTNNELNGVGTIAGMDFFVASGTKQRNISIYMARTNADNLSSGYVTDADFTQVYSGTYTFAPGVNHIDFTTPFAYGESGNLLLLVRDNTGSYESGLNFVTHTASGTRARYIYQDSAPYTSAPSGGTSTTSRNNIQFYYYPCEADPDACSAPLVVATEVGVTNATIAWTAGNAETSFDVEYKLQDDTVWTSVLQATSEETTTITDLTPNNYYNIRVTNDCGGYAIITVYTECGKIDAYPFVESFDGTTIPSCWTGISNYNSSYPNTSTSYRIGSTGRSMYMYCYASTSNANSIYTLIATPAVDTTVMPIDTLQVSFAIYASSNYTNQGAVVGVMTDPTDFSTFVPVDTVHANYGYWVYDEVPLSAYNGNGTYIAIVSKNIGYTTNSVYIDDLEINVIPSCPRPRDLAVDTATLSATSATINWTATGASDYIIEYGLHNFQLGTGNVETSNTNSVSLTGLNPSSIYDVYVRGLCEGNDSSAWSFLYSFYTDCVGIESLPYYENFNGWTNTTLTVPYCWSGNSTYSTSYPNMSTSYDYNGVTGGKALYMYNYYSTGYNYYTKVSLPEVSSQISINTTQLVFRLRNTSSSTDYQGGVVVGISVDPNDLTTFTPIDTIMATYNEWTIHEVPFDTYTGAGTYVTIRDYIHVASGTYGYNNTYIDDITLEAIPTCRRPVELTSGNATTTTVDLSWTDLSNPTSWVVEYGPIGFELGTGTKVAANSNPFTLTGLSTSTFYEYYVRGVCAGTDSSDYSREGYRFATLQVPAAVPYSYDFESATEWANWQVNCNDTIVNWYRGNAVANGGTQSMYISADTGATNSTLFRRINATAYRDIDFGTIDSSFVLTFDARIGGNTSGVYDALAIILVDPNEYVEADNNNAFGTPWGQINDPDLHVYDYFRLTNNEWQSFEVPFDTISGVHRVAFFWFNQSTQTSWQGEPAAVDNIAIDYSTCPRPLNLHATPGTTTAALSWQGTADGYVVYYRAVDSTNLYSLYTTSNTCTISGLTSSGVEYVWAVRALCGSDTSMYSDSHVFMTTCFDGAVTEFPYIEDFEIGTSCWNQIIVSGTTEWVLGNGSNYTNDNAYSGDNNALFYYSGSGQSAWLISPVLNLNAISEPYLKFAHLQRTWASDQDTLGVYYRVHQDSAWVYLASYTTSIEDWQLDSIGLPVSSATFQIGFFGFGDYGYGVAIDSVVVNGEGVRCPQPILTATVVNNTATISWSEAGNYELQYREASATEFGDVITVTNASSYLLADLLPMTDYVCQVRRDCGEEDGYSIWSEVTFTTEDLPCIAPTDFTATNITYTSATVSWTDPSGNQIAWFVEYGYGANFDTITVTSPTVNLSNLYDGTTYTVKVQGQCSATIYSDWSEAFTFSTTTCEGVSNLTTGTVTANSAVINWTAGANQTKWEISYGMEGFTEGNGTNEIVEGTPSFTITGLESDMKYDVYVRNICQEGVTSAWSNKIQFRTTVGINTASTDNVRVQIYPNPANSEATVSVDGINGKVEFVVADMNGRMIVTETINCEGSLVKTIDVSNLAKGAYFVHIYNDDFNTTRKLVVK